MHSHHRICKQNLCILIICKLHVLCHNMDTSLLEQPDIQQTTFFPQWLKANYQQNGGCVHVEWMNFTASTQAGVKGCALVGVNCVMV